MLSLSIKLILSHIIGDFVLQPTKWIEERSHKSLNSKYFYYHIGVHFLLVSALLFNNIISYWVGILIITVSHLLIDLCKIYLEKKTKINRLYLFVIDQILHLIFISIVVNIYFPYTINYEQVFSNKSLLILIALMVISSVSPIALRMFFERWNKSLVNSTGTGEESLKTESLQGAGKYIGILERFLIVIFININFPEGIGYLLAAKSIFRFGDLTHSKEKKLTEYILIGTFMSFAIAIIIGFALKIMLAKI